MARRFRLEHQVRSGGMGTVWRATDTTTGGPVALKVMHASLAAEADRFEREAALLARLSHPTIVRHVAHGITESSEPFLVMQWLQGEDLETHLAKGMCPLPLCLAMARRMAQALAVAHELGVVHRDIKPSNIFLPDGDPARAVLIDFGIARLVGATRRLTGSGVILGTLGYMAPEQARGDREVDARADIFSLGCVLFECLAGRPAFAGERLVALLARLLIEPSPRVRTFVPDTPEALDAMVASMMAKDPQERPANGARLLEELDALCVSARPEPSQVHPSISPREQRVVCVVLASAAGDASTGTTLASGVGEQPDLLREISAAGAQLHALADGSRVAVPPAGSGMEQAQAAARCALAMQRHLPGYAVAVSTGRAEAVGGMPMGEAVERAAKLVRAALAGAVLVDLVTAPLLEGKFELLAREDHWLLGAESEEPAVSRRTGGSRAPLIGRRRELAQLFGLVEECVSEPVARAILLSGPPGMGKSRLGAAFVAQARDAHPTLAVHVAQGDPMRAGSPFEMLAQIARAVLGIGHDRGPSASTRLLAEVASRVTGPEHTYVAEFLAELVGLHATHPGIALLAARQDAILMGDRLRTAFESLLESECARRPALLILEDLHWGDLPTITTIDRILRNLADRPLCVIATSRPEIHDRFPHLWADRGLVEIPLLPLRRQSAEELVRGVLGPAADPAAVDRIVQRSDGNAFYMEELSRAFVQGRDLALPESVLGMVQARFGALEAEQRRMLRAASVFGETFWKLGAEQVAGAPQASLVWRALEQGEFVRQGRTSRLAGQQQYSFCHGLLREAAYDMLTASDRVVAHRLAGDWLEQSGEPDPLTLAEHHERGEAFERAAVRWRQSAEEALEGNDFEAAARRAERGLACARRLPDAAPSEVGALHTMRALAHGWRAESTPALAASEQAMRAVPPGSRIWSLLARLRLESACILHDDGQVEATGQLLLIAQPAPGAAGAVAAALAGGAYRAATAGYRELGRRLLGRLDAVRAAGPGDEQDAAAYYEALDVRAIMTGSAGQHVEVSLQRLRAYEAVGDARRACTARNYVAYWWRQLGRFDRAEAMLSQALRDARRMGLVATVASLQHELGLVLACLGRLEEGLSVEQQSVASCQAAGDRAQEAIARVYVALILLMQNRPRQAEPLAREGLDMLGRTAITRPIAVAVLADALVRQRRFSEVLELTTGPVEHDTDVIRAWNGSILLRLSHAVALRELGRVPESLACIRLARQRVLDAAGEMDSDVRQSFLDVDHNRAALALAGEWGA